MTRSITSRRMNDSRFSLASTLIAGLVLMIFGTTGCVHWKHKFHEHGLGQLVHEHHGNYHHCSDCGKIVPKEGFHGCRNCCQVPPYHGYQPTCWRQFPSDWGCQPEYTVNQTMLTEPIIEQDFEYVESVPEAPVAPIDASDPEVSDVEEDSFESNSPETESALPGPIDNAMNMNGEKQNATVVASFIDTDEGMISTDDEMGYQDAQSQSFMAMAIKFANRSANLDIADRNSQSDTKPEQFPDPVRRIRLPSPNEGTR